MARILVIDDDGIARDALSVFLTRAGHEVVTAADGANGVQLFKSTRPDLVILDRDLPILSGSGVFDSIRKVSRKVPVLVLSGYTAPEEVEAYLRCGAAAFLSKADGLLNVLGEVDKLLGVKPQEKQKKEPEQAFNPPAPAAAGGPRAVFLVAEDDEQMRGVLVRFLSSLGHDVMQAVDGTTALELARKHRPDIVLLDIFMPGMDGVDVLKTLAPELPETGFLMVTGNLDEEIARSCLQFGAFDYIPKPVNLEVLERIVKTRLFISGKKF